MPKNALVVLLFACAVLCALPSGLGARRASPASAGIAAGKSSGASKLWADAAVLQTPVAPISCRLKVHALRGPHLELCSGGVIAIAPRCKLPGLWLPDRRAAIRQGCPRFDRPDSASAAA